MNYGELREVVELVVTWGLRRNVILRSGILENVNTAEVCCGVVGCEQVMFPCPVDASGLLLLIHRIHTHSCIELWVGASL